MPHLRLLRPLLATPKPRLRTLLEQAGQSWVEDPSNRNMAYKRPRLRGLLPLLAAEGLAPPVLAEAAHRLAATRLALEEDAAALLARACALYPEGYARLKAEAFAAAPWETAYRALAFLLERVGGGEKELRRAALEPVCAALRAGRVEKNLTLHGCVLSPARRQKEKGQLLLLRELAAVEGAAALVPGGTIVWDGRFQLRLAPDAPPGLWVAALGVEEAVEIHKQHLGVTIPKRVLATLPCIRWRVAGIDKVVAVPHLGVWRDIGVKPSAVTLGFSPPKAFARPGFSYILPTSTQALRGACE